MASEVKAKGGTGGGTGTAPVPAKPRVSASEFVRQVRAEVAKVVWPSRGDTIRMTIMVLIMTTLLAVFFVGVDQILGRTVKFLLSLAA
jgi:preprotein translocase subunit SecE